MSILPINTVLLMANNATRGKQSYTYQISDCDQWELEEKSTPWKRIKYFIRESKDFTVGILRFLRHPRTFNPWGAFPG